MDFGIFLHIQFPTTDDSDAAIDALTRQAELVEDAGFDSLWIPEHHFTEENYPDNWSLLSYLTGKTDEVTVGTMLCLVPLYNPMRLAEQTANADMLSSGRFVFGAGVGYRQKEFEVMGVEMEHRGARMDEALDILERAWTEDPVSYEGEQFQFEDVHVNPKPVQTGGPPVWLGGSSEAAIRRAATRGDAWVPSIRPPLERLEELYEVYNVALEEAGRTPSARPLLREGFVAETREEAFRHAKDTLLAKYNQYMEWRGREQVAPEEFEEHAANRYIIGSPDDVIDEIEKRRERLGTDHLMLRTRWTGMPADVAEESIRLFGEEVVPSFE